MYISYAIELKLQPTCTRPLVKGHKIVQNEKGRFYWKSLIREKRKEKTTIKHCLVVNLSSHYSQRKEMNDQYQIIDKY